ncbi:hypothetical protein DXG01_009848, partial [Tephrocybe rancida]
YTMSIAGPALAALNALSLSQLSFIRSLPKAELHAHLNGSIPIALLQDLARGHRTSTSSPPSNLSNKAIQKGIDALLIGPALNEISDFFGLFPAPYTRSQRPRRRSRVLCTRC